MVNLVQDIHLSDVELWEYFKKYWDDRNYVAALQLLNTNQKLLTKYLSAEWLNALTSLVYELENNSDPDFKADKIQLSYIPPALETGGVYFQLSDDNMNILVSMGFIQTGTSSVTISYPSTDTTLVNFMAFDNLALCKTDVTIGVSDVTFSTAENVTRPIVCLVFYAPNELVSVATGSIDPFSIEAEIECDDHQSMSNYFLSTYAVDSATNKVITCDNIMRQFPYCYFELAEPPSSTVLCYVVYTDEYYLLTQSDTETITSPNTQTILNCFGYLVNLFCEFAGTEGWMDAVLQNDTVVINLSSPPLVSLRCTSLYS